MACAPARAPALARLRADRVATTLSPSRRQRRERIGETGSVGQRQLRVELEQRHEDEAAAGHLAVRQGETVGRELEVAEQQQVDVERPRAVPGSVELAATSGLDLLAEVEQGLGLEPGADPDRGVEEVGLVEHLADRLGLIGGGDRLDLDPGRLQCLDRGEEVGPAVADVRPRPR